MSETQRNKHEILQQNAERENSTLIWRTRGEPAGFSAGAGDRRFIRRTLIWSMIAIALLAATGILAYRNATPLKETYANLLIEQSKFEEAERVIKTMEDGASRDLLREKLYFTCAESYVQSGRTADAMVLYQAARDYPGAQEAYRTAGYTLAKMYEADGDFLEAGEAYAALGEYLDAVERGEACSYAYARERLEYGYYEEAMRLFYALGSYEDAETLARNAAAALSGNEKAGDLISLLAGLSDEQLQERERLKTAREALPHHIVATGYKHTVARMEDGTVIAAGSNLSGQCDVYDWTDITAVAAGAYHTVGLKADGTVVATGMNTYKQCDVSGWSNVAAIYAGAYNTLGVTRDGRILNTGYQTWDTLKWRDIASLSLGDYALCGVMENGQPLYTHSELVNEAYYDLVALDAATANSAGLKADGTVVTNGLDVSGLENILAIDCTPNGIYALDDTGRVYARAFSYAHLPDVSDWRDIIAISASATHVVGVRSDGRVLSRGASDMGQCETMDWIIFSPQPVETPFPATEP
jgi:tetratricopeptide (TPR) repeat protein